MSRRGPRNCAKNFLWGPGEARSARTSAAGSPHGSKAHQPKRLAPRPTRWARPRWGRPKRVPWPSVAIPGHPQGLCRAGAAAAMPAHLSEG
eukprot:7505432-Pyramimonas_sp.AAC.1